MIEDHGHDASEDDLLHNLYPALHRVSLESEPISPDQKSHLRTNSGFPVFQAIENRRWELDLGVFLVDEVSDPLFILGIEK